MATKRITKNMRLTIADSIVAKAFDDREADLQNKLGKAGYALYLKCMGGRMKMMSAMPDEYFSFGSWFYVITSDSVDARTPEPRFELSDGHPALETCDYRLASLHAFTPMPNFVTSTSQGFVANPKMTELIAYDEIADVVNKLGVERRSFRDKTNVALKSFSTIQRLIKGWPEVEKLIPEEYLDEGVSTLPAVQLVELNKVLNQAA